VTTIKGALFPSKYDTGPMAKGFVEIDGVRHQLAVWKNTSKTGEEYWGVTQDKPNPNKRQDGDNDNRREARADDQGGFFNDDPPF
jgi:hypothetical protein